MAVNNLQHVVGWSALGGDQHAFRWRHDGFFDLGPDIVLEGINDADIVVGRPRIAGGWACCYADASGAIPPIFHDLAVHADSATAVARRSSSTPFDLDNAQR